MSRELWDRVQAKLFDRAVRDGEGRKTAAMRDPIASHAQQQIIRQ